LGEGKGIQLVNTSGIPDFSFQNPPEADLAGFTSSNPASAEASAGFVRKLFYVIIVLKTFVGAGFGWYIRSKNPLRKSPKSLLANQELTGDYYGKIRWLNTEWKAHDVSKNVPLCLCRELDLP